MKSTSYNEFITLLTQHQEVLRCYLSALMPGSNDVLDILQEVNIVLWEKREQYEMGTNFKAWSYSIARFKVMNHQKKKKRQSWLIFNDKVMDAIDETPYERDPDSLTSQRLLLKKCLSKLKAKDVELLKARYVHEEPLLQYSKKINRSSAGVRVTLHRLRTILRQCITENTPKKGVSR